MNSLVLPSPIFDTTAIDRADLASGTRRHYKAEIERMRAADVNPFNYDALAEHASTRPSSGRSNLKAALAIIMRDYVNKAKTGNASIETIQRFLWLIEAMSDAIIITTPETTRTPHWLSQEQVDQITAIALGTSMRDYIIMASLLGFGPRREELETLTFDSLSQIPAGGRMVDVVTIRGKGDKKRVIQISSLLASHLREWKQTTGGGRVARKMNKGGTLGESISAFGIFTIVRKYGALIGIPDLDPHDCRRTYGRLMYEATGDIMLVKDLLGHTNVKTTQTYIGLGLRLDLAEDVFPVRNIVQVSGD